jgi:hypothetical protein
VSGIAIETRMPEHRDGELGQRQRDREAVHAREQNARVPLMNARDQVALAGEGERGGEAADDRGDATFQAEARERVVDRTSVVVAARDVDVRCRSEPRAPREELGSDVRRGGDEG